MEYKARSVVKAVLWSGIGLISMMVVGFLSTGSWGLGGRMALINTAIGLASYIVYERIWARIRWGLAAPEREHG